MRRGLFAACAVALLCFGEGARADISPGALFSDGAVFQRGAQVPVWGEAEPGEEISVGFGGQKKTARAGADGKWQVALDPMPASSSPSDLVLRGKNEIVVRDVVVGEVWLCAGQSNMAMALAEADGASEEAGKEDRLFRAFRVPERPAERPWETLSGEWLDFSPKRAGRWSAMPYFFGKRLRAELGVPVGVIVCAWGGSSAVAWMSERALRDLGGLAPEDVIGWRSNVQPSKLYNGMLRPLAPYAVEGAVWYQGETEGEPFMNPYAYREFFPAMIEDWRRLWGQPELPFYWVQLPNLRIKSNWEIVRESQAEALKLPATGMIPTIDIGREKQLHPSNKNEFGDRLANLVLAKQYGKRTWAGAPKFERAKVEGNALRLEFADAVGLSTKDGLPPKGFVVAGADGRFWPAEAKVEGGSISLSSPSVASPVAARYAWESNPQVNVANAAGLPMYPFRTDSWPVEGSGWRWVPLEEKASLPQSANGGQMAAGDSPLWKMELRGIARGDLEKLRVLRTEASFCQIAISGDRRGAMTLDSPAIFWTTTENIPGPEIAGTGLTLEARVQMFRATDPFRGFDLEAGVRRADGKFCRYRISVVPMRLFAFQKNEIRLLASNLDNCTDAHTYRIAIRPDGIAQIYFDGKPAGIFGGEVVEKDIPVAPYISAGKQVEAGEFTANLFGVSFDARGAFAAAGPR